MKSKKYSPEHIEALQVLEAALTEHGYRVAPFQLRGALSKDPARTHGVVFYHPLQGGLHNIQLNLYLGPPQKNEPTVHVFHIDHYGVGQDGRLAQSVRARLGLPLGVRSEATRLNTDLYVLPHEVVGFAAWLPHWVDHLELGKPYVAGPYPLEGREKLWSEAWSRSAMAAYRAWQKIIEAVRSGSRPPVAEMS